MQRRKAMEEKGMGKGIAKVGIGLAYVLVGGAIGATVGMLMAPRPGAETRERIAARVKEGSESLTSGMKDAQEQFQKAGEKIGLSSQRLFSKGKSAFIREGKDVVAEAIDAAKRAYLEEKDAWMLKRQ
jgi:gas vesicle protein